MVYISSTGKLGRTKSAGYMHAVEAWLWAQRTRGALGVVVLNTIYRMKERFACSCVSDRSPKPPDALLG